MIDILHLMEDPKLLGERFAGTTWRPWKSFLSALFALPMGEEALKTFRAHTGRLEAPGGAFNEAYLISGRRSGKSIIAAVVATYLAAFKDYSAVLTGGEQGILMVLASDRRQAQIIFRYVDSFFSIPILRSMVVNRFKESLELNNGVTIEIHTSSFRATRGFTCIAVIADELAFWSAEDSSNPDREVLNALRPGLATTGGLLLGISSPYGKKGVLWENFKTYYGREDESTLVWRAASREMNPSLSLAVVAKAYVKDPAAAAAEYGGQFRDDIQSFLPADLVESRMIKGRFELTFDALQNYVAFVDPSGGVSDSMTLAIAHKAANGKAVLDLLREIRPPFSPENVCGEFSTVLRKYKCYEVTGDRYGGIWPSEEFAKSGIVYKASDKNKSEIYLEFLAQMMSGQVELLDNATLAVQLGSLERRVQKFGKDSIDHPVGSHDDISNAASGACVLLADNIGGALTLIDTQIKNYDNWMKGKFSTAAKWFAGKPSEPVAMPTEGPVETRVAGGPPADCGKPTICPACKMKGTIIQGAGAPPGYFFCNQCHAIFDSQGNVTSPATEDEACDKSPTNLHVWRKVPGAQKRCDYCALQRWDGPPANTMGMSRAQYAAGVGRHRGYGRSF